MVSRARRKAVALAVLVVLAALSWQTMEPGRVRWLVEILLAGFGLRIVLAGERIGGAGGDSGYDRVRNGEDGELPPPPFL